ncbi:coxsackievirus and adenovirus receptor homolog [Cheilinus undulatus]|uniref:coxsackievirus and adenovirus receptor homolog n=1 Tax=Cheilinus undulatus TaxID=241271 RepID=UPI001BD3F412|nr:coxsackievirus and adenovirus receptor homolog [Cheilinus undulatus]
MAERAKKQLWGFMFMLAGAVGQHVNYPPHVCAITGSTVTLPCTFTPNNTYNDGGRPVQIRVIRVRWCQNHLICQGNTQSVYDSHPPDNSIVNNHPRYKYLGDRERDCTLQISNVTKKDNATLRFRMEVNHTLGHFTEQSGVKVMVEDATKMRLNSSSRDGEVTAGHSVTIRCESVCVFHPLEVTWYRDNNILSERSATLNLSPLTAKDSGNYTCALKDNKQSQSDPYSLNVTEGPVNVPLIVGAVFGVLLVLVAVAVVLFIMKRRLAAEKTPRAAGVEERKPPDAIYSDVVLTSDPQRGGHVATEDVSYAAVEFKHKNQNRAVEQSEDSVIYSSVASRG